MVEVGNGERVVDATRNAVPFAGLLVTVVVLDRATLALTGLAGDDVFSSSLLLASIERNLIFWVVAIVAVFVGGVLLAVSGDGNGRLLEPWSALENGSVLRWLSALLIVYTTWVGAFGSFNFFSNELYLFDRGLLVALALLAFWRPVALLPLVVVARVLSEQTLFPFVNPAVQNIDDLLAFALLIVAAGHLWYVATGRRETSPILLGLITLLAAHFYLPGRGKLSLGWLTNNNTGNLALSSYTAGWLANTDGGALRSLANLLESAGPVVNLFTTVAELGSVIAVLTRRLSAVWLAMWILLHIAVFAATGFVFIGWMLLEVGLLVILLSGSLRSWVDENATVGRGLVAVVAVLATPFLFHPPGLSWLDSPVSTGYRLEAVGESGERYEVPISVFSPLDVNVSFLDVHVTELRPPVGAYGALGSVDELRALEQVETFDDLAVIESQQPVNERTELSEDFLITFFDYANRGEGSLLRIIDPPARFLTQSPGPSFSFQEPLVELQLFQVTNIHRLSEGDASVDETLRTELVLTIEQDDPGAGRIAPGER